MSEDAWRAARYLKEAAGEVERAANRIEEAQRKLTQLFEDGYGSSVFSLLELFETGGKVDNLLAELDKVKPNTRNIF